MATDNPVACLLSAEELRARSDEIAPVFARVEAVHELPDGYRFAFSAAADGARDLVEFILAERACCPFFTFELTFPSPHEAIWLTLRGGQGVKEFVRESLALKVAESAPTRSGAAAE
jgi:hypothetical protein